MNKLTRMLIPIFFGIILFGCQNDINLNNPESERQKSEKIVLQTGSVGDRIWKDLNRNGLQDNDEAGFSNVTVALYSCDPSVPEEGWLNILTVTDVKGNYRFDAVPPGSYKIRINIPDGWALSPMNVGENDELDSDFDPSSNSDNSPFTSCFYIVADQVDFSVDGGLHPIETQNGSIGDRIWIDKNRNGKQDNNEEGFPGVTVALYSCDPNAPEDSWLNKVINTDDDGYYKFNKLEPGKYKVRMNIPEGWKVSPDNRGSNDELDSDFEPSFDNGYSSFTGCFEVIAGQDNLTIDGGLFIPKLMKPRSFGYWKTHSKYGPAKYNPTWALVLPDGEDSEFYLSEKSWYKVLKTSPKRGNAYYILAHQFIAARLNILAGCYVPDKIGEAIDEATKLFEEYTPDQIGERKGNHSLRMKFLRLASVLGKYNNGEFDLKHFHR